MHRGFLDIDDDELGLGGDDEYSFSQGGPYIDDDTGGDIDEFGELDDIGGTMLDDDDEAELEALLGSFGGDEELGGRWSKKLRRLRKKMHRLSPTHVLYTKIKRAMKKKKRKKRAQRLRQLVAHKPATAKTLNNKSGISAIASAGGVRFLRVQGATVTVSPIPVESRMPSGVCRQNLRQSSLTVPNEPLISSATVTALPTLVTVNPGPAPALAYDECKVDFSVIRVDFGLPGISAAAGNFITFRVFTQQTIPLLAGPEPDATVEGAYDSGDITIQVARNIEVATIVLIPWRVVQTQALPRLARINHVLHDPADAVPEVQHSLALNIIAAPTNTVGTLQICTPTHPTWQITAAECSGGSL